MKFTVYNNFINVKNISNFALLSCTNILFSKKGMIINIGSYVILTIILIHLVFMLFFYLKNSFNKIKEKIADITFAIKNSKILEKEKERYNKELIVENINHSENNDKGSSNYIINVVQKIFRKNKNNLIIFRHLKKNPPKKKLTILNNINLDITEGGIKDISKNSNSNRTLNNNLNNVEQILKFDNKEIIIKSENIMKYNEQELNNASYEFAIKNDNRNYIQYYFSLLLTKHILISTFFNKNDYNIKIIKIDLFILNFALYFTINALFFNDNTMHKIYEDKGSFNFIYQLPQILYSSIISGLINIALKKLALSQDDILEYKQIKNINNIELNEKEQNLYKKLKIKFGLYFIISSIILLFFWYYLSMFCAIYQNTQIHLVKDTLISYGLGFIYPFGIYLIPGIFRIPSLSDKKNNRKCLYNISKLLQII